MSQSGDRRVIVLNPASGDGNHDRVRETAAERGYDVVETRGRGDGVDLARDAAATGAGLVAACGGDGTVNEVVRGIAAADALDAVTFGVIPAGTGNNFATTIGIGSVDEGFDALDARRLRRVDVGAADGRLFVNSCVSGLTAAASDDTPPSLKRRLGVVAYVIETLHELADFEGFRVTLTDGDAADPMWEGEAVLVLIGNARRLGRGRVAAADVEDGRFDVTVIESIPPVDLIEEATTYRLFGRESDHVTRLLAPAIDVEIAGDPVEFSFDGEIATHTSLHAETRPGALELCVGEEYDPNPDGDRASES